MKAFCLKGISEEAYENRAAKLPPEPHPAANLSSFRARRWKRDLLCPAEITSNPHPVQKTRPQMKRGRGGIGVPASGFMGSFCLWLVEITFDHPNINRGCCALI